MANAVHGIINVRMPSGTLAIMSTVNACCYDICTMTASEGVIIPQGLISVLVTCRQHVQRVRHDGTADSTPKTESALTITSADAC